MRTVGFGHFIYQEMREWAQVPDGWETEDAPAIAVDSHDRVHVLIRNKNGLLVFDREGQYLRSWGEDLFDRPHGLFIAPDDSVFVVDDWAHSVFRFTPDGEQTMLIETKNRPTDTGYVRGQQPVERTRPPFNEPTGCALAADGGLYVTDGYGNACVHKFSPDGKLHFSWGEPGSGAGQFITPHGVCVDDNGLVYISDRMNARVQVFSPQGEYVSEWSDAHYPNNVCEDAEGNFYIAELGGVFMFDREAELGRLPARITVRDDRGQVRSEWGEGDPTGIGRYFAPHALAVDSRGDLYVSCVTKSYSFGKAPNDYGVVRKYVRS